MPSSSFPGPALPAADQIMPFPGEELGSTVCGDRISQELSSCYTNSYMLCSSDKDWTWEEEDTRQNDWGCRKLHHVAVRGHGSGETFRFVIARFSGAST